MPPGFHALIAAQALSALADNAVLIVAIARLQEQGAPGWWAPLLKFAFTLSYVFLAPVVGPLADAMPKARLMGWMNGVKIAGMVLLLLGWHPVAAFTVIGFGAAAYAPAKYGLVTEIVGPQRLVAANGWIEVSVVCAALLGTGGGGLLVSALVLDGSLAALAQGTIAAWRDTIGSPDADGASRLSLSLLVVLGIYGISALLTLRVPHSGASYPSARLGVRALWRDFVSANRTLWRDAEGGLSLAVTTIFWGVGATLQFAVLRWAADVHGLGLDRGAFLQATVALGVIGGAAVAGRHVALSRARRMLPAGVVLGLLIAVTSLAPSPMVALPLLVALGFVGGVLVVPLNALLQHRGHVRLSAGRSIAVQGFNENLSIVLMLSTYAAVLAAGLPIVALMVGFGLLIAVAIGALAWRERRRRLGAPLEGADAQSVDA